jgi:hypothetical protein
MVKEEYGRGYNSHALAKFDDIPAVLVAIYYKYQNMNFKLLSMCFT